MRRNAIPALIAVVVMTASLCLGSMSTLANELTEKARAALIAYTEATLAGSKVLAPMLTPEFQIMRGNGVGYDRHGYLTRAVPRISGKPDFSHEDIVATQNGDLMVVRYFLRINEVIEGVPVKKRAPRLTVFRNVGGDWKVVSHANFGAAK